MLTMMVMIMMIASDLETMMARVIVIVSDDPDNGDLCWVMIVIMLVACNV